MYTLILIVHLLVCVFLIFVVLVQSSKGAQLGAAFGGSSQTLFGARGASTFLSKLTTGMAVVFMITSLTLAVISVRRSSVVVRPAASSSLPGGKKASDNANGFNRAPGDNKGASGENKAQGAPADNRAEPSQGGKASSDGAAGREKK